MARPQVFALVLTCAAVLAGCGNAGRLEEACQRNSECADDELCATNFCTGIGFCALRPETCDETDEDPVCGCDGFTYANTQCATFEGVRLAQASPCVCQDNSQCVRGQYCALDDSCSNLGQCASPPASCDATSAPVCGCDFVTYENACEAARAGVRVSADGECECQTDDDCNAAEFCNATVCDGPGNCALRSDPSCMPEGQVIGCDGVEYESQCAAAEAGVRIRP